MLEALLENHLISVSLLPFLKLFLVLLCLHIIHKLWIYMTHPLYQTKLPVVPYYLPYIGSAFSFLKDPLAFAHYWSKKLNSEVFGIYLGGRSIILVLDPMAGEYILSGRVPQLSWRPSKFKLGRNVVAMSNDEDAKLMSENRLAHAVYERHLIKEQGLSTTLGDIQKVLREETIPSLVLQGEKNWKRQNIMDLFGFALWQTTTISLLGYSKLSDWDTFQTALVFNDACLNFIDSSSPQKHKKKSPEGYQAREELVEKLMTIYNDHYHDKRENKKDDDDDDNKKEESSPSNLVLDLDGMYRDKMKVDENRCRYHLLVLIATSTINTMPTLFWVVFYLLANPAAYKAVVQEVMTIVQEKRKTKMEEQASANEQNNKAYFSLSDLDRMETLDSLITETLRLKTTASIVRSREALEDVEIQLPTSTTDDKKKKTITVKKGTVFFTYPTFLHRDESIFHNATTFQWDRFLPDKTTGKVSTFTTQNGYVLKKPVDAFGGGPTMCPGRKLARAEIKIIVATMIEKFEMRFSDGNNKVFTPPTEPTLKGAKIASSGMPTNDVSFEMRLRK